MTYEDFTQLIDDAIEAGLRELHRVLRLDDAQTIVATHQHSSETRLSDIQVQKAVMDVFAAHPIEIISEDAPPGVRGVAEFFVIIDPIDGTTNLARGIPFYAIAIAGGRLPEGPPTLAEISIGAIATSLGRHYRAVRGEGTTCNKSSVKTSSIEKLTDCVLRPSSQFLGTDPILGRKFANHLYLGSTAIELALLAAGQVDLFVETKHRKIFDFAAAYLLIHEAGGIITNLSGESLDREIISSQMRSPLLVAGNTRLHKQLVDMYSNFRTEDHSVRR